MRHFWLQKPKKMATAQNAKLEAMSTSYTQSMVSTWTFSVTHQNGPCVPLRPNKCVESIFYFLNPALFTSVFACLQSPSLSLLVLCSVSWRYCHLLISHLLARERNEQNREPLVEKKLCSAARGLKLTQENINTYCAEFWVVAYVAWWTDLYTHWP